MADSVTRLWDLKKGAVTGSDRSMKRHSRVNAQVLGPCGAQRGLEEGPTRGDSSLSLGGGVPAHCSFGVNDSYISRSAHSASTLAPDISCEVSAAEVEGKCSPDAPFVVSGEAEYSLAADVGYVEDLPHPRRGLLAAPLKERCSCVMNGLLCVKTHFLSMRVIFPLVFLALLLLTVGVSLFFSSILPRKEDHDLFFQYHDVQVQSIKFSLSSVVNHVYAYAETVDQLYRNDTIRTEEGMAGRMCTLLLAQDRLSLVSSMTVFDLSKQQSASCASFNEEEGSYLVMQSTNGTMNEGYIIDEVFNGFPPSDYLQRLVAEGNVTVEEMYKSFAVSSVIKYYVDWKENFPDQPIDLTQLWTTGYPTLGRIRFVAPYLKKGDTPEDDVLGFVAVGTEVPVLFRNLRGVDSGSTTGLRFMLCRHGNNRASRNIMFVLDNNWGQPHVGTLDSWNVSRFNSTGNVSVSLPVDNITVSDITDPLMKKALRRVDLWKTIDGVTQTVEFYYSGYNGVVTAEYVHFDGMPLILVVATTHAYVAGPLFWYLFMCVGVAFGSALIVDFVFFIFITVCLYCPMRRVYQLLMTDLMLFTPPEEVVEMLKVLESPQRDCHSVCRFKEVGAVLAAYKNLHHSLRVVMAYLPDGYFRQLQERETLLFEQRQRKSKYCFKRSKGVNLPRKFSLVTEAMSDKITTHLFEEQWEGCYTTVCTKLYIFQSVTETLAVGPLPSGVTRTRDRAVPQTGTDIFSIIVTVVAQFGGSMETLSPECTLLSFGSPEYSPEGSTTVRHGAIQAACCALYIQSQLMADASILLNTYMMLDTAVYRQGRHHSHGHTYLLSLGRNVYPAFRSILPTIRVRIGMTEATALHIREHMRVIPLEALYVDISGSGTEELIILYELLSGTVNCASWRSYATLFNNAFRMMIMGEYDSALSHFEEMRSISAVALEMWPPRDSGEPEDEAGAFNFYQLERLMDECASRLCMRDNTPYVRKPLPPEMLHYLRTTTMQRQRSLKPVDIPLFLEKYRHSHRKQRRGGAHSTSLISSRGLTISTGTQELDNSRGASQLHGGLPMVIHDHNGTEWQRSEKCLQGDHGDFQVFLTLSPQGTLAAMKRYHFVSGVCDHPLINIQNEVYTLFPPETGSTETIQYLCFSTEIAGSVVVIMEYFPGGSLLETMDRYGRILPTSVIEMCVVSIVSGLRYLHRRGIVHGDLRPQNVLVGVDGRCKLKGYSGDYRRTVELFGKGASCYRGIETIRDGVVTPESDVYCVGLLLLTMITGSAPWRWAPHVEVNRTSEDLWALQAEGHTRFAEAVCANELVPALLPPSMTKGGNAHLWNIVRACCCTDPSKRPNVDELLSRFGATS